jgi:RimJ/RimL family protein N-acetyltransferase
MNGFAKNWPARMVDQTLIDDETDFLIETVKNGETILLDLPSLESARLIIERLKVSDAEEMHHYRSMPEVDRFQTWDVKTEEGAAVYIAGAADTEFGKHGTWFQLAVRDKSTGRLIGDLGLHFLDADGHQVEVGITVSPEQQKRGYASEALATVLEYLFVELKFHRAVGSVDRDNQASSCMLQKLGFRKEGSNGNSQSRSRAYWRGSQTF